MEALRLRVARLEDSLAAERRRSDEFHARARSLEAVLRAAEEAVQAVASQLALLHDGTGGRTDDAARSLAADAKAALVALRAWQPKSRPPSL